MKLHLLVFYSLIIAASSLIASVDTGSKAPDFTLTDSYGGEHRLSDYHGKYVILEWTRHNCPFVEKFYDGGHMQALQKGMTEKDVIWLQVGSSAKGKTGYLTADQATKLYESNGTTATAFLLDTSGEVGRLYDARTTPHMYLIRPDGILLYQGAIDSIKSAKPSDIDKATNYVQAAYERAVSGEQIEQGTTVPYGCGVKY